MANPGDILAPKLLSDGTFEETVLTPALIGAAADAHGHSFSSEIIDALFEDPPSCRAALEAASASDLATLESSLGTLSQQNADAAAITGGSANFDTLEAATAHAAPQGTLTISATGDILGSGTNRLLGFIAGGATY